MDLVYKITQDVAEQELIEPSELNVLQDVLSSAIEVTHNNSIMLTSERWLAVGVHLLAVIRRVRNNENLPPIDQTILQQVCPDMLKLSRQVLDKLIVGVENDDTEVLLLAVHFEAAKVSESSK